jgi:hypothetical protein
MKYEGCRDLDDGYHKNGAISRTNVTTPHTDLDR